MPAKRSKRTAKNAKSTRSSATPNARAKRPKRRQGQRPQEDWTEDFLEAFKQTGVVSYACEEAGIDRATAYRRRQADEDFAVAWADAEERGTELLEAEAHRRAAVGVRKPLLYKGEIVETVQEYSDQLLMFLLKARRPEKYRENVAVDHSGNVRHRHGLEGVIGDRDPVELSARARRRIAQVLEEEADGDRDTSPAA